MPIRKTTVKDNPVDVPETPYVPPEQPESPKPPVTEDEHEFRDGKPFRIKKSE